MERLFRFMSLRRRRSPPRLASPLTAAPPPASNKSGSRSRPVQNTENERPPQWVEDEKKVRDGRCSFQVKYLGSTEVHESRGIQVCEEAIKKLKQQSKGKRKAQRSILYVSGDALRVVDELNKGLLLDQTIEKVSFCAPDRFHKHGFAYICRDGTTRRWLCHGFLAVKESGERLSHAVGCAFAICLEKKLKREREAAQLQAQASESPGTFTRASSMRVFSIAERLQDPQALKPSPMLLSPVANEATGSSTSDASTASGTVAPSISSTLAPSASTSGPSSAPVSDKALARPRAPEQMVELQRQRSARFFRKMQETISPFKRQFSMRTDANAKSPPPQSQSQSSSCASSALSSTSASAPSAHSNFTTKDLLASIFENAACTYAIPITNAPAASTTSSASAIVAPPASASASSVTVTASSSLHTQTVSTTSSSSKTTSTSKAVLFPVNFSVEPIQEEPGDLDTSFDCSNNDPFFGSGMSHKTLVLTHDEREPSNKSSAAAAAAPPPPPPASGIDSIASTSESSSLAPSGRENMALQLSQPAGGALFQPASSAAPQSSRLSSGPASSGAESGWSATFAPETSPAAVSATSAAPLLNGVPSTSASISTANGFAVDPFGNSQVQALFATHFPTTPTSETAPPVPLHLSSSNKPASSSALPSSSTFQTVPLNSLLNSTSASSAFATNFAPASSAAAAAPTSASPFQRFVPSTAAAPSAFSRGFLYSTVRVARQPLAHTTSTSSATAGGLVSSSNSSANDPFDVAWAARQSSRFRQSNPFAQKTAAAEGNKVKSGEPVAALNGTSAPNSASSATAALNGSTDKTAVSLFDPIAQVGNSMSPASQPVKAFHSN